MLWAEIKGRRHALTVKIAYLRIARLGIDEPVAERRAPGLAKIAPFWHRSLLCALASSAGNPDDGSGFWIGDWDGDPSQEGAPARAPSPRRRSALRDGRRDARVLVCEDIFDCRRRSGDSL